MISNNKINEIDIKNYIILRKRSMLMIGKKMEKKMNAWGAQRVLAMDICLGGSLCFLCFLSKEEFWK